MKIMAVDDEVLAVEYMERLIKQVEPEAEFNGFTKAEDAIAYLSEQKADVALLDIELGENCGLEFAKRCEELCESINIIFVTGYSQYTLDAFKMHVSGYLMKPVRAEDLRLELKNLRHPILADESKKVRIQTFGNFELFVNDQPIRMPLSKCKECLAYLVDRKGALVTVPELASILWEDKPFDSAVQNSVHQVVSTMMKTLKEAGVETIIIKHPREIAIDRTKITCDYYQVLEGDREQLHLFIGEYMNNYSWAEETVGELAYLKKYSEN